MKKIIFCFIFITLFYLIPGCDNLEYIPVDQLSNEAISQNKELLENVTIGSYSRLKESNYVRLRHFMQELPGDDLAWCKQSGDHLNNTYGYLHLVNSSASLNFWRQAYYGIYSTNRVIESIDDSDTPEMLQLKGENLFLRALMHYDLVRIFSRPYSQSPETNLGIMIRDKTEIELPPRSTVKETFKFIENDLLESAKLMTENKSSIYASKEVAWALLSRLYLYMGEYSKAIEFADKVINSGRYSLIPTNQLASYYTIVPEINNETIFAVKFLTSENLGKLGIGSLYHEDGGWGEIYVSTPYLKLIYQNPNDERIKFIQPKYSLDNQGNKIPDALEPCGFKVDKREGYSKYFNLKYTLQDGVKMLASPVILRLAEMYLIKAEAYAKTPGMENQALEMVNIIRKRAGLSGEQLFSLNNVKGYQSILEIVLDERRLELAWEGHRSYDLFRNNKPVIRDYTFGESFAGPSIIPPTSPRIVHYIPEIEITLNPNLVQNP